MLLMKKNLKNQIKAFQNERKRIDLLINEYFDDNLVLHNEWAIKSRKESLWILVNHLVTVFGIANLLFHQLFQDYTSTEIHQEGLKCLIACYLVGLEHIKGVYCQEILEIECK